MKLFILILNYNRPQDTLSCIKSLKKSHLPAQTQIIILNNGPTRPGLVGIKTINNHANLGFAAGNNPGIKYALKHQASHIMIVNPDVQVPRHFAIPLLAHFKKDKKLGLIAPVHRHRQKNKLFYGLGGQVDWKTGKCTHQNTNKINFSQLKYCQFVSFACVLIKKQVFEKAGYLDERYFMYLEDVDFCLTAKKAGFKVALDPKVIIDHKTSSSFSDPRQKLKYSFVSQLKLINKWLPLSKRIQPILYTLFFYPYLYLLWTWHRLKYS